MATLGAVAEAPKPFSFVHDAKLAWNKKLPVSWVEKDGAKVLFRRGRLFAKHPPRHVLSVGGDA